MSSEIRVNQIQNRSGLTTTTLTDTGVTIAGILTVSENLNVGGVLTYEDVTNIDSVGVITARNGIRVGATGANTLITGNGTGIGIGITTPTEELHIRAATPVIRLEDGDNARQSQIVGSDGNLRLDADNNNAIADTNIAFRTDGGERLRIGPVGQLGIGGANYGTSGQVLTSQGSGSAVQWATPSSGLAMADMWRLTTTYSIPNNSTAILSTANWERPDQADGFAQLGTGMSVNSSDHAAGVWTFPSTGFYLVTYNGIVYNGSNDPYEVLIRMEFCENGSTFNIQSRIFGSGEQGNYNPMSGQSLVDVTDTSNVKMRLRVYSANANSTLQGNSNENRNYFTVIRLGDT